MAVHNEYESCRVGNHRILYPPEPTTPNFINWTTGLVAKGSGGLAATEGSGKPSSFQREKTAVDLGRIRLMRAAR